MADDGRVSGVDESLVARVASLSVGSQRWLKTAIQAIRSSEGGAGGRSEREIARHGVLGGLTRREW